MHLVIFEDANWIDFAPISISHPVFAARAGMYSLIERQVRTLGPTKLTLWVRPELHAYCKKHLPEFAGLNISINTPLTDEPAMLLNGRSIPETGLQMKPIVAPGLSPTDVLSNSSRWNELATEIADRPNLKVARYLWDLLTWNQELLKKDIAAQLEHSVAKSAGPFHLVEPSQIYLGKNVSLGAGCVLDAHAGPVYLADDVSVGPNSVLQGPCFIGPKSHISPLASIRPGTNLGSQCKAGGEVSNSIFMNCSNKAHEGFVGDSYIGQWVNFGAGATTSNLKNTYGSINIRIGSRTISTGKQFLGSLVGDHTKFAIHTRLMTGSYIGFSCMVASSKLTPTYLPSFSFVTDKGAANYDIEKAKEVMTNVMKRRGREWDGTDEQLIGYSKTCTAIAEL